MDGLRILRALVPPPAATAGGGGGANRPARVAAAETSSTAPTSRGSYMSAKRRPLRKLWPEGDGAVSEKKREEVVVGDAEVIGDRPRGNWVMNIMRVQSLAGEERGEGRGFEVEKGGCAVEEEVAAVTLGRDSFSKLLRRVTLVEMELYAKLSYLSNLAYTIPKIKAANLLKYHGLHLVTSSLEKKAKCVSDGKEQSSPQDQEQEKEISGAENSERQRENSNGMNTVAAYQIAASAASYLLSHTKGILPFGSANSEIGKDSVEGSSIRGGGREISTSETASFVATTDSATAVVAGKEEMKQAVADDLSSLHSCPCEWFVCDDASSSTRYFAIQGSESLASWQANLLFEPVQFEGLDVLVHRGIYEAAKGIYQQMLPEIQAHLKSPGNDATLHFTGHSLGGSLALLINLMLLIRGEAPASSLLPVITFGAPTVMCGGNHLLQKLRLPQSHVQSITMHRDIVPRAFSCNYPDHVAKILTTVNGKFRNHPCLKNQKMLYAPMGKLLILQPEEKFSPHHHLLPSGSGLYLLGHSSVDSHESLKLLQTALSVFLNSPHPLEILSDRAAYGSEGTVHRDHDMSAYLRSVQGVIRQELRHIRKAKREQRRIFWWPVLSAKDGHSDITSGRWPGLMNSTPHMFTFSGAFHGGKETLKRFRSIVASQHMFI